MTTLEPVSCEQFRLAEKSYGDAMAASLSRAFPCHAQ